MRARITRDCKPDRKDFWCAEKGGLPNRSTPSRIVQPLSGSASRRLPAPPEK